MILALMPAAHIQCFLFVSAVVHICNKISLFILSKIWQNSFTTKTILVLLCILACAMLKLCGPEKQMITAAQPDAVAGADKVNILGNLTLLSLLSLKAEVISRVTLILKNKSHLKLVREQ